MLRQGDTGDWIGTFSGHKGAIWGVAITQDATKAASGAADFTAKVWDAVSGTELLSFPHKHIVKSVDFSQDGSHLVTSSNEKLIRIWDLSKPEAAVKEFPGHTGGIKQANYFQNDTKIVSCSDDKTLRVWDIASGQEEYKMDFPSVPNSLEVSRDGRILTVCSGRTVSFFDACRSSSLPKINEVTVPTPVSSASLHPDSSVFVCGGDDFKMYKFDYQTGQELESFKGHFGPIHCTRFSPDGELYASGSEDGTLRLWQTTVGKTYGLWKCVEGAAKETLPPPPQQTLHEVAAN